MRGCVTLHAQALYQGDLDALSAASRTCGAARAFASVCSYFVPTVVFDAAGWSAVMALGAFLSILYVIIAVPMHRHHRTRSGRALVEGHTSAEGLELPLGPMAGGIALYIRANTDWGSHIEVWSTAPARSFDASDGGRPRARAERQRGRPMARADGARVCGKNGRARSGGRACARAGGRGRAGGRMATMGLMDFGENHNPERPGSIESGSAASTSAGCIQSGQDLGRPPSTDFGSVCLSLYVIIVVPMHRHHMTGSGSLCCGGPARCMPVSRLRCR